MFSTNHKQLYIFLSALFLLDQFFFGFLIWHFPNESPWGTNHFFNFVYEKKKVEKKPKKGKRILIIGSSIAYYSFDRTLLNEYLKNNTGVDYSIEYISYAGMTPLDCYLLRKDIQKLEPDLVIFPLNFIDLRLHRAYIINPNGTNENVDEKEILLDALNFGDAPQSKFAFPMNSLLEFFPNLPIEKSTTYLSAYLFSFYRYREIYSQNLRNLYNHRFGRNTSYHGYAGVQIPERVNSLGWTGRKFSFIPKSYMIEKGFWVQIVPEILKNGQLSIEIKGINVKEKFIFDSPGWKKIKLNPDFILEKSFVSAEVSEIWHPYLAKEDRFDHSRDEMGVRLQQTFGLDFPNTNMQYEREERIEDLRYIKMSDSEYEEYFNYRLLDDFEHRPGIRYIHALMDAKKRLTKENFTISLHLKYLKLFLDFMNERQIKVILINNPENPLALKWYEKSKWYEDHLLYLQSLSSENQIQFLDFRNKLKMQDFSDFHHFTYPGMKKMNSEYGEAIVKFSKKENQN